MKQLMQLTAAATLLALPLGAMAQSGDNPSGPYIGVGIGQFNVNVDRLDDVDDVVENIADSDDTSMKIFAGYRLFRFLAIEGAYIDLGNPGDDFETSGSDGTYRLSVSGFSASLLGIIPIGPVELFGKVGQYFYDVETRVDFDGGLPDIDTKDSRDDFMYGVGISTVLFDRLELRAEYERIELENASDSDAFWLAAAWRF